MSQGIIYLLTGAAHAARLVVSIWSLRKFYDGPVTVFTTRQESHVIGGLCAADKRLNIVHRQAKEARVRRNAAFLTKLDLLQKVPYEVTAYLDADTLIVGSIADLLDVTVDAQFHATRFSNWISSGRTMRKRISAWRTIKQSRYDPAWLETLVNDALIERPAVNGGVFSVRRDAKLLQPWRELAYTGWRTFICDEIALQLLLHRYPHHLLDCRFNCSPKHAKSASDVRIWHFHGEKHLASGLAMALWLPAYKECVQENAARIADWSPAGDVALETYLARGDNECTLKS